MGFSKYVSITVAPFNNPPTASIPVIGKGTRDPRTVTGTVTVQISASDTEDQTGTLTVLVCIDNDGNYRNAVYNSVTQCYEWKWDTTTLPNDTLHTINAHVIDITFMLARPV
ncbi:MAG: hypothetical protein ACD_79C00111G0004 [uncultured bacterium]|nr:MAG: hypothetical protein ACD_79C00111G0004 [uncultured bacterium]